MLRYRPRAVLIYEGDNDTGGPSPIPEDVILAQLREIIEKVHEALPETRIYVLSVKPSVLRESVWPVARKVSEGFREIADSDSRVFYVDVATPFLDSEGRVVTDVFVEDDLHFNALGNAIWGSLIKAALMPVEARFEQAFDR